MASETELYRTILSRKCALFVIDKEGCITFSIRRYEGYVGHVTVDMLPMFEVDIPIYRWNAFCRAAAPISEAIEEKKNRYQHFGGKNYITVNERLVNIRQHFYYRKTQSLMPSSGIAVNFDQWKQLCSSLDYINKKFEEQLNNYPICTHENMQGFQDCSECNPMEEGEPLLEPYGYNFKSKVVCDCCSSNNLKA